MFLLFRKCTLDSRQYPEKQKRTSVGKKIVSKCKQYYNFPFFISSLFHILIYLRNEDMFIKIIIITL